MLRIVFLDLPPHLYNIPVPTRIIIYSFNWDFYKTSFATLIYWVGGVDPSCPLFPDDHLLKQKSSLKKTTVFSVAIRLYSQENGAKQCQRKQKIPSGQCFNPLNKKDQKKNSAFTSFYGPALTPSCFPTRKTNESGQME